MRLLPNGHLMDLKIIAASGQAFRMHQRGGAWFIVQGDCVVRLEQREGTVWYETWPEGRDALVERLFRCDIAVGELQQELQADPYVAEAARAWQGLWLLRQAPWETTVSFIISANKHFTHIQQCCVHLAETYGDVLQTPWGDFRAFPSPDVLTALTDAELRACKVGYRSAFIKDAARRCAADPFFLASLEGLPTQEAVAQLTQIHGIGDKIADCILLFAYARDDVVPYDVWLRRICADLYDQPEQAPYEKLRAWHRKHFGRYAGWAQQWLFCHAREVHKRGVSLRETWFQAV